METTRFIEFDGHRIEVLDDVSVEIIRSKTPAQRLAMTHRLWKAGRDRIVHSIRSQHPEWDQQAIQSEFLRRMDYGTG